MVNFVIEYNAPAVVLILIGACLILVGTFDKIRAWRGNGDTGSANTENSGFLEIKAQWGLSGTSKSWKDEEPSHTPTHAPPSPSAPSSARR